MSGLLVEIQTGEVSDIKDSEHPLIASLCYAVSALTVWKYREPVPEPKEEPYNPLTYGLWPGE